MGNNRFAIRFALMNLLLGQTSADQNVYTNRENSLWRVELPALIISTSEEPVVPATLQGRRYNRTLTLTVEAKVEATESVDDALDALLAEVETIVSNNPSISGTVQAIIQTNTETHMVSQGERDIGVGTLTFECKYTS